MFVCARQLALSFTPQPTTRDLATRTEVRYHTATTSFVMNVGNGDCCMRVAEPTYRMYQQVQGE